MNEFILHTIGLLAVVIAACVIVIRKKVLYRRAIVAGLVVIAVAGTGQLVSREGGALFSAGVDSQLERTFARLPLYGVLKKQEPELWEKLHQQAVVMLKEGKDEQTVMDALPALEALDSIYIMFSTPLIASSSGTITLFWIVSALAPG